MGITVTEDFPGYSFSASPIQVSTFARQLCISGNGLVLAVRQGVGEPSSAGGNVRVYERVDNKSDWTVREDVQISGPLPIDNGGDYTSLEFGHNPSLNNDGSMLVVAAPDYPPQAPAGDSSQKGIIITYLWNGSTYVETDYIVQPGEATTSDNCRYGEWGLDVSGDGLKLVVYDEFAADKAPSFNWPVVDIWTWGGSSWTYSTSYDSYPEMGIADGTYDVGINQDGSVIIMGGGASGEKIAVWTAPGTATIITFPEKIYSMSFMNAAGTQILASANGNAYVATFADSVWTVTEPYIDWFTDNGAYPHQPFSGTQFVGYTSSDNNGTFVWQDDSFKTTGADVIKTLAYNATGEGACAEKTPDTGIVYYKCAEYVTSPLATPPDLPLPPNPLTVEHLIFNSVFRSCEDKLNAILAAMGSTDNPDYKRYLEGNYWEIYFNLDECP